MELRDKKHAEQPTSRAPRGGLQIVALIIAVMALLAMYGQYQRIRRDQIETVKITPAAVPESTIASSPTPAPAAP